MYNKIFFKYGLILPRMRQNNTDIDEDDDVWSSSFVSKEVFWSSMGIIILIAMVSTFGNFFVIHAVIKMKNFNARFRYLNRAVLSLAIADFLLSLFGTPFSVVWWYWGKNDHRIILCCNIK